MNNEIVFSEEDFNLISRIADASYGIQIPRNKKDLLHARIAKRMRALGIVSFNEYMVRVANRDNSVEKHNFLTLLTTNTTSFFREPHHFRFLEDIVLPGYRESHTRNTLRVWSAGCSFGHEPYSIAATLIKSENTNVHIDATDVDQIVLNQAKSGVFPRGSNFQLTAENKNSLFRATNDQNYQIRDDVYQLVKFETLNLMDKFPFKNTYDIIFCRNVVIYFGRETQQQIWQKFLDVMNPGGYLFLGHSERITGPIMSNFESVGLTIYRRRGARMS